MYILISNDHKHFVSHHWPLKMAAIKRASWILKLTLKWSLDFVTRYTILYVSER